MLDFPKSWTKFVGTLLFHVSPRCTIVLLYENEESPSPQARCNHFRGRSTFPGAEPPAGPPKIDVLHGEVRFPENLRHAADLGLGRSRAEKFSQTSRFQDLKIYVLS